MRSKVQDRHKAITLRKQGKSYREIMEKVPVSKGTLSKWFAASPLTKKEAKFLKERVQVLQDKGRIKAAEKNKERYEKQREKIRVNAKIDFRRYQKDPFFALGLALYWTSGTQQGSYVSFGTSDAAMMQIMTAWMVKYLKVEPTDFTFRLYVQKPFAKQRFETFWSRACAIPRSQFQDTIYIAAAQSLPDVATYKGSLRLNIMGVHHLVTLKTWQKCVSEYYVGTL